MKSSLVPLVSVLIKLESVDLALEVHPLLFCTGLCQLPLQFLQLPLPADDLLRRTFLGLRPLLHRSRVSGHGCVRACAYVCMCLKRGMHRGWHMSRNSVLALQYSSVCKEREA